jgi:WD40 repeat protein
VRVNVPLELAEKVLPTINKDRLHDGKVKLDLAHANNDVDLRAMVDAIRTSKDGEFVTVQSKDNDIRVAKKDGYLLVHIIDKEHAKKSQVEVKVPMKVVDALFSAGKDELDVVAALHALGAQGDTELVSVKDDENTIRVWLDSKNVAD